MSLLAQLDQRIRHHGGLIVSCQPVPGSPLDNPAIVAAMALAAEQAGAEVAGTGDNERDLEGLGRGDGDQQGARAADPKQGDGKTQGDGAMKALTISQPFASLIASGEMPSSAANCAYPA